MEPGHQGIRGASGLNAARDDTELRRPQRTGWMRAQKPERIAGPPEPVEEEHAERGREKVALFEVMANSPKQLAAFIRNEVEKWSKVIKTAGVTAD